MTIAAAQKYGRHKTIKATTVLLIILIALVFFGEVKGDFANGILFFLEAIMNVYTIVLFIVLYLLSWYFAGRAAKEVVFDKKNFVVVALKYAILISLAICLTLMILQFVSKGSTVVSIAQLIRGYYLPLFWKSAFCLSLAWLWATNKMKRVAVG